MKRLIDSRLLLWKADPRRKPLLVRGARQVGKTFSVRSLGQTFDSYVEVNFERSLSARTVFDGDLDARRILRDLSLVTGSKITPGETLLFLDELQDAPRGIIALRYLYEEIPELHVVAAGSLLEFQIEAQGMPVGRVDLAHMFPMSLVEFAWAKGEDLLAEFVMNELPDGPVNDAVHLRASALLGEYLAIGGMPEAVRIWHESADLEASTRVHHQIIQSYREDFENYASKAQVPRVAHLFEELPHHVARKWKFANVSGDYRARDLRPALELLEKCHIIQSVYHTSAQGLPLGAGVDRKKRKVLMLDVGLMQAMLGLDPRPWILSPTAEFVNRGVVIESFVGQELQCYSSGIARASLYYWHREAPSSNAEVDYIVRMGDQAIPLEVKSGARGRAQSIKAFLATHSNTAYGVLLSPNNVELRDTLLRYPLYLIAALLRNPQSPAAPKADDQLS